MLRKLRGGSCNGAGYAAAEEAPESCISLAPSVPDRYGGEASVVVGGCGGDLKRDRARGKLVAQPIKKGRRGGFGREGGGSSRRR